MKKLTPNKRNETEGPACPASTAASAPAPNPSAPQEPFISKDELARRLHVGVRTIERWQHLRMIPFIKCGRFVYFNWPVVVAHLDTQSGVSPTPMKELLRIPVIGIAGDPIPKEDQ